MTEACLEIVPMTGNQYKPATSCTADYYGMLISAKIIISISMTEPNFFLYSYCVYASTVPSIMFGTKTHHLFASVLHN